jgi:hypothetical protein
MHPTYDKDGEMLEWSRANGHGNRVHRGRVTQMNLITFCFNEDKKDNFFSTNMKEANEINDVYRTYSISYSILGLT